MGVDPRRPKAKARKLEDIISRLRKQYGPQDPPPATTAFALVLWEKVAYLATDEQRGRAFALLRERVGLTERKVLAAPRALLCEIAAVGGKVGIDERAQRMHDAAALVIDEFDGSLDNVLKLDMPGAMRGLQRIYGIGEPGAEKILLLTRTQPLLALDSNGLRTLLRIGYGADSRNYSAAYRSTRAAVAPELKLDFDWLIQAHLLLRRHGQEVCKTTHPRCEMCSVKADCAYASLLLPALQ